MKVYYAFKDYIQNGLGADLIRLTGLMAKARDQYLTLYMVKDDVWEHTPEQSDDRTWTFYFEETIPKINNSNDDASQIDLDGYEKTPLPPNIQISKFAYRSQLLKSLYRPQPKFQKRVDALIKESLSMLLTRPFTLIHIRRGDKVSGPWREGQSIPIDNYLQQVQPRMKGEEKRLVFIMTDSPDVIREVEEKKSQYNDIEFIWDKFETRRDGYSYKLYKNGYSDEDKIDEMVTNMKNLWLMEHAESLIGARSSFLFIAGELLNGKPGISLEENVSYPTDL